jgi:hypothetical protein
MRASPKQFPVMEMARDLLKIKVRRCHIALVTMSLPHQSVAKRADVMVRPIAISILSFCFLGSCGAFCQGTQVSSSVIREFQSNNSKQSRNDLAGGHVVLPDAPSGVVSRQTRLGSEPSSTLTSITVDHQFKSVMDFNPAGTLLPRPALVFEPIPSQREKGSFFRKYLDTSFTKQETRYQASAKNSLLGRATDAAARVFVIRDETGRHRLNTSYFVGVLTSVAVHNASRPYWARSNSIPIGDVGSTVGNDAGMNLMHEFGPGLRQAVNGHLPSFVFRVEKRIVRSVSPQQPLAGPR